MKHMLINALPAAGFGGKGDRQAVFDENAVLRKGDKHEVACHAR